jgi:glycosyltransferase involved in cell wall biosynthesis
MSAASQKPRALILLPEAPFPVIGGGPLRTASIVTFLAERYRLTAVHFRLEGEPDPALQYPAGMLAASHTIELPQHSKAFVPRLLRNLRRAIEGVPPLVDRFGGQAQRLQEILGGDEYDLIWVEHFWAAGYVDTLQKHARKLVLDLHNVESAYFESLLGNSSLLHRPLLRHFAARAHELEQRLLERFPLVLTTSAADAARLLHRNLKVLPNTIPWHALPQVDVTQSLAMTGNFAYHPNQQGLHWFLDQCWPEILRSYPACRLRLIGKEIRYAANRAPNVDFVGPVADAIEEIAASAVAIVPLLSGSGTRLKILEAWAAGTAVVSTSLGAEGLEGKDGVHLSIADGGVNFARQVCLLLGEEGRRRELARQARQLYEERYVWGRAHQILSELNL